MRPAITFLNIQLSNSSLHNSTHSFNSYYGTIYSKFTLYNSQEKIGKICINF